MRKKRKSEIISLISILLIVLILAVPFVSAGWFGDFLKNLFGKSGNLNEDIGNGELASLSGLSEISNCFDSGQNPIPLCTCNDLNQVRNNLGASYILMNDIDCSGFGNFVPIGSSSNYFAGIFNGNGHLIKDLYIHGEHYLGLFSSTSSSSQIKNFGLENVDVSGGNFVGALVGVNRGSISQVFVSGKIVATLTAGGLVGLGAAGGIVSDCYSMADVTGSYKVGGILGYTLSPGTDILRCYSTGKIITTNREVGGLVGFMTSELRSSYSVGEVYGTSAGGLVGICSGCFPQNNYWYDVSGDSAIYGDSNGILSLTKAGSISDFYNKNYGVYTNPPSWDFVNVWRERDNDFPIFQWQCVADCVGKECGDDGCGGSCGTCNTGYSCNAEGICILDCIPQTCQDLGKECEVWDDGCGGSVDCDGCGAGKNCNNGVCESICVPDCEGKQCGEDGCGGSCGVCEDGESCHFNGHCIVLNSLVAYYNFEGNADDVSGNGNNGINYGADFVNGKSGQSASFEEFDSIFVSYDDTFDITDEITLSAWVYVNENTLDSHDGLIYKPHPLDPGQLTSYGLFTEWSTTKPYFRITTETSGLDLIASSDLELNQWHHVLGTYDSDGEMKLYIDGVLDKSRVSDGLILSSTTPLIIGSKGDWYFKGMLDEVKIWNYALSEEEVEEEYWSLCIPQTCQDLGKECGVWDDGCGGSVDCDGCGAGKNCNNGVCKTPIAYYNFEGNADDVSGNGNNGNRDGGKFETGEIGQSYSFDGVDNHIVIPYDSDFNLRDDFTISAWVYPMEKDNIWIIGHDYQWMLYIESGHRLRFYFRGEDGIWYSPFKSNLIDQQEWQYVAATYHNGNVRLYINGQDIIPDSNDFVGQLFDKPSGDCEIGCYFRDKSHSNVKIDEIKVFDFVLDDEQILEEYKRKEERLRGYYPFEGNVYDFTGEGHNGTINGNPALGEGKIGKGYTFDGDGDYINLYPLSGFELIDEVTVSAWIKTSDLPFSAVGIVKRGYWTSSWSMQQYGLMILNGVVNFGIGDGNGGSEQVYGGLVNDNQWHQVVGVLRDNNFLEIYVDGVLKDSIVKTITPVKSNSNILQIIGALKGDGNFFNGMIDEVKIWNYALEPEEILREYQNDFSSDLNNDGLTDQKDLIILSQNMGLSNCISPDWCNGKDITQDGIVNINDVVFVARDLSS